MDVAVLTLRRCGDPGCGIDRSCSTVSVEVNHNADAWRDGASHNASCNSAAVWMIAHVLAATCCLACVCTLLLLDVLPTHAHAPSLSL